MKTINKNLKKEIEEIKQSGLYKEERIILSKQSSEISISDNSKVLNFCANNYLGLSNHSLLIQAAKEGIDKFGFGLSSVRFICGTQSIHRELENKISLYLNKEDTILYTSCFDANGGLFETLFNSEDLIISDQLNHASIIDGVRLCKAQRARYDNSDMNQLEGILKKSDYYRYKIITTDGVFSMDGYIAKLKTICDLADRYNAMVHVDDSHATGILGPNGKGSADFHGVLDQVDIITSTFGKALGGASGGFTSSSNEIISILRQKSRPYLFSNSLAPNIVYTSIKALELIENDLSLKVKLESNTEYFRKSIIKLGFDIKQGEHPIVPIMIYDAKIANQIASEMLKKGIYVIAFSYPVVPKDQARIRVQISADHTLEQLNQAINAFQYCGEKHQII
jgi:glycine C-acetyltransferase